jgi:hypothetical protein
MQRPHKVHLHHPAPVGGVGLGDRRGEHGAVHAAEGLRGAADHRLGLGVVGHVGGQGEGLAAVTAYLLR